MRTRILWAAALVLLAGCQKFGGVGSTIRFSAVTRPDAESKAAYSDVVTGGFERIDWSEGDQIKLAMKNTENPSTPATQIYSVTGISTSGRYSKAGLEPYGSASGLMWGTGEHCFWAAYPETATFGTGADMTITGTIASPQTLNYITTNAGVAIYDNAQPLYLFAGKKVAEGNIEDDDAANLDFDPMMTTFDFEVGSNTEDDMVINSFVMTTEYAEGDIANANLRALTGDFTATYDASMARTLSTTAAASSNRSITVNFASLPGVSQTKKVRFRVIALPQTIQGLTVVFNTTETLDAGAGTTTTAVHKLRLKQNGSWISFTGRGKANISGLLIPGAEWKITFSGPRVQQWTVYDEVVIGVE